MSVSLTVKPMRASLTSRDGVKGRFETYNTPLPEISSWNRKGNVFGWVPKCGSGSLGRRPSLGDKTLPEGGDRCVFHDESPAISESVSTSLVGLTSRACSA